MFPQCAFLEVFIYLNILSQIYPLISQLQWVLSLCYTDHFRITLISIFIIKVATMKEITNFFKKSVDRIILNSVHAMESLQRDLTTSHKQNIPVTQAEQSPYIGLKQRTLSSLSQKTIINQKVLQIDVIESAYIPKEEEQLQKIRENLQPIHEVSEAKAKESRILKDSKNPSHVLQIENEKKNIIEQLKKLDQQIAIIKGEVVEDGALKRKQKNIQEEQFRRHAKQLVRNLKNQKKEIEERKRKQAEKQLLLLQQEDEQNRLRRQEQRVRLKQEKRRAIEARLEVDRHKREERKLIQKESNRLILQLKKQEDFIKQKDNLPSQFKQMQQKKKTIEKRPEINFREIEEHQRRYMFIREQQKQEKKDRSTSVNRPIPKYEKNTWTQKIEEEDLKRKEQQKIKEIQRKAQLQKRLKYGQLVKNIFLPKRKEEFKSTQEQLAQKFNVPDSVNLPALQLPKISENEKRITESKAMKKFTQNQRAFATAHNYKKATKQVKEETFEDGQKQKLRKIREQQIRKQTKQRLKKLQNKSLDPLPKSKPKYQNYLGKVKIKKKDEAESWQRIFEDNKLSKQEKYKQMLKKASAMEIKAKMKEELRKDGDQDAVNLYIGSIQAKLALLQKF